MEEKFSDEKLLEFRQAGFSDEEIALFLRDPSYAPSDEELDAMLATQAVSDALDSLPADDDAFDSKVEEIFGDIMADTTLSDEERAEKVKTRAAEHPELAKQISSVYFLDEFAEGDEE